MNLLTNDTAPYRGARTGLQAFGGFLFGLIVVIVTTPGLPERVQAYIQPYEMQLLLWLGIPTVIGAGVIGYLTNLWRDKQPPTIGEGASSTTIAETGTVSEPHQ